MRLDAHFDAPSALRAHASPSPPRRARRHRAAGAGGSFVNVLFLPSNLAPSVHWQGRERLQRDTIAASSRAPARHVRPHPQSLFPPRFLPTRHYRRPPQRPCHRPPIRSPAFSLSPSPFCAVSDFRPVGLAPPQASTCGAGRGDRLGGPPAPGGLGVLLGSIHRSAGAEPVRRLM